MSLVPQQPKSTFVTPHYLPELGEEGLTSTEISQSIGMQKGNLHRLVDALVQAGELSEVFNLKTSINPNGCVIKDYLFNVDDAKFIVTQSSTKAGRAYCRFLIQCEKAVLQRDRSPYVPVAPVLRDALEAYSLLGVPLHLVQQEAVKDVKALTGRDLTNGLALAPAQQRIPDEDVFLAPTELAKHLGFQSAIAVNRALERAGLQVRRNGEWVPTEGASGLFFRQAWTNGSKSGYNLRWRLAAIAKALKS